MNKLMILISLGISGCSEPPSEFYCNTPIGPVVAKTDKELGTRMVPGLSDVRFTNDVAEFTIPRSMCVKVVRK
jgi:hypothetical protein